VREVPADLAERYGAHGWWDGRSLGQLLEDRLREVGDLEFRVWSGSRPWRGTMADVHGLARRFAAALADRGIGAGDVVAMQLPNCVEAAVVFWGTALAGAVIVPVVHFYGPKEVGFILDQVDPDLVVVSSAFGSVDPSATVRACADVWSPGPRSGRRSGMRHLAVVDLARSAPDLDGWCGAAEAGAEPVDVGAPSLIAFTSGTTAHPKGVVHTHRTLGAEVRQLGAVQPVDGAPLLTGAPVGHAIGMLTGLLLPVERGQPVHLIDVWDPAAVLAAMSEADVNAGSGATFFLQSLLDHPDCTAEHLRRMAHVGLGGSSVPRAFTDRVVALGISVTRAYGSTEHPSTTGATFDEPQERRATTDGRALPGVELRIVDPDSGADLPAGRAGEVWSRGPDLFAGYTDRDLTAEVVVEDGWYRTGDIGVLDADGWLTITDRLKDVIIRGGENVSAAEVEAVVLDVAGVAEVAVVAGPDPRLGERPVAFLRVAAGAEPPTLVELRAHLRAAGLARQKWPEELHVVTDLPRTPSGKVRKVELRARLRSDAASTRTG
jgi:acyl-CoA synthetase (AMP-forming)/AMP-acid ligase II